MAVHMSLGGNTVSGEGFLVAPQDGNFESEISLFTDGEAVSVTLQADPAHNVANLVFPNPGPHNLSAAPTAVTVFAQQQSNTRGDTTIQVLDGGASVLDFAVTSISNPVVHFKGKFEARFATDGASPYSNPQYTDLDDSVVPPGRTWSLEGEPEFCPGSPVPVFLTDTGMGRNVRLNNPDAVRGPIGTNPGQVGPVVSTVHAITGVTDTNLAELFTTGDPVIGQLVNFGPDTYLAGNNDSSNLPGVPAPEEVLQRRARAAGTVRVQDRQCVRSACDLFQGEITRQRLRSHGLDRQRENTRDGFAADHGSPGPHGSYWRRDGCRF